MAKDKKKELLNFLDRRAFDPILRARESDFPDSKKMALKDVQNATRKEKERFHKYGSAEEVVVNFKRDLHSGAARKVNSELETLGLPRLADVKDEFEDLGRKLGVAA
ncbi:MAG: hypothetical protein H3C68_08565 [Deltaproteobacteria bacterium]|nr:hypothetical protein [Deltaproteobacteria bacterium]MBZ0219421.1 hypothetical protein [Deltaproteobacteria bacterium]